jgi:hypothetical protein
MSRIQARMHSASRVAIAALAFAACRSPAGPPRPAARYIVTESPIALGIGSVGLCVAIDPADPQGVWWWEPGGSGCSSRSTGPGVFPAERARVFRSQRQGTIEVQFRIQLIQAPTLPVAAFRDVALTFDGANISVPATGAQATAGRRNDLEIPEAVR